MADDQSARFAPDEPAPTKAGAARSADWRVDSAGATSNRSVLATLTLLALLAIAGVLIGIFIFWFGSLPEPRFVSVPIGEYENAAWPVNPWANQDAERLAGCFPDRSEVKFAFQQQNKFRELLGQLAGQDADRPLVLHVTALAAVRERKVYLLPGDAGPDDPTNWVPVEDLLDAFDRAAANRGKLLILDLAHSTADPFSGVLRDDVSTRLHDLLNTRSATLPFPVLTSCGAGEESLPADAERCSGFAFYLAEGLRGAADRYLATKTNQDRDGEITLAELRAFVTGRVSRWARLVHNRKQSPVLYGPVERGPIFRAPSPSPANPPTPAAEAYPQWLADGWSLRTEKRKSGADRGLPESFARLTAALLRSEREWLRSGDTARAERNWIEAKKDWQDAERNFGRPDRAADVFAKALGAVRKYRLAAARQGRPSVPEDWKTALDQYQTARLAVVPGKPDESGKFRDEWLKKVQPEKSPENRLDATGLLWDRFRLSSPTLARARVWGLALGELRSDRDYAEAVLLKTLAAWDPRQQSIASYPGGQVNDLLRVEEELSQTLALGPNGFELVEEQMERSRVAYVAGQKSLFFGAFGDLKQAGQQLNDAANGFSEARRSLDLWQKSERELDVAVTVLLDVMPSVLTAPRPEFDHWISAVRAATALADEIAPTGRERTLNPARLAAVRGESQVLPAVRDPFAVPPGKKDPDPLPARANPTDALPLERLVAGTAVPVESRRKAWDTIQADQRKFHESAREQDAADDAANDPTVNQVVAAATGQVGEPELMIRRAKVSIELLKLAGYVKAGELASTLGRLEFDPTSDAESLGQLLRKAWVEELPKQAMAATAQGRSHEADRIARSTPPGAAYLRPAQVVSASDPPAARKAASAYRVWVRDQLLDDQKHRPKAAGTAEFYETVRQDLDLGPD
jgi:hypothetical protein